MTFEHAKLMDYRMTQTGPANTFIIPDSYAGDVLSSFDEALPGSQKINLIFALDSADCINF